MAKIKSIQVQNNFNNGKRYEVGETIIVTGKNTRNYTISEIIDKTKEYYDSKEYEFHILAKTESNTTVLLARIINCPIVIEEII
jgi:hypothetical protein